MSCFWSPRPSSAHYAFASVSHVAPLAQTATLTTPHPAAKGTPHPSHEPTLHIAAPYQHDQTSASQNSDFTSSSCFGSPLQVETLTPARTSGIDAAFASPLQHGLRLRPSDSAQASLNRLLVCLAQPASQHRLRLRPASAGEPASLRQGCIAAVKTTTRKHKKKITASDE